MCPLRLTLQQRWRRARARKEFIRLVEHVFEKVRASARALRSMGGVGVDVDVDRAGARARARAVVLRGAPWWEAFACTFCGMVGSGTGR